MTSRIGISDERREPALSGAGSFGRRIRVTSNRVARLVLTPRAVAGWLGRDRVAVPASLGRQWIVALLLPAAALGAAGVFTLGNAIRSERMVVLRMTELLAVEAQRAIEAEAGVLATVDASLAGLSWFHIRSSPSVQPLLTRLAATSGAIHGLALIDPDGRIAAASESARPLPVDLSDREYVRAFHERTSPPALFVSGPVVSRTDGVFVDVIASPRYGANPALGSFDGGLVVAGMRPETLERLFAQVAEGTRIRVTLLRHDGVLLARIPQRLAPDQAARLADGDPAWPAVRSASRRPTSRSPLAAIDGSLLRGVRITGAVALPTLPLVMLVQGDPALVLGEWLTDMLFPTVGAVSTTLLLLMLGSRARREIHGERERGALRTMAAQASQRQSQQRAELEGRLRQTEKAAALGQLSAGVAHDFNNLLHAVLLGTDGLRRAAGTRPQSAEVQRAVRLIERTAERGVALTRRMLDFARRDDTPNGGGFDFGKALGQAQELLTHSFGQTWPVSMALPAPPLPPLAGDSATFETVIINLAVNARDAMPRGGAIEVTAELETAASGPLLLSGSPAVRITVRDRGMGMDPATLARAGEAFFTTKPVGAGTGLGLSMARGFAQRVGGLLEIASEPGVGTTITLRLPIAAADR